mgnify:FL=1
MEADLNQIVRYLNQDFKQQRTVFSALALKETNPCIILMEDHRRRRMENALYQHPDFIAELESLVYRCLIDVRGARESSSPTEIFISKAQLYSPYHYLVTFL